MSWYNPFTWPSYRGSHDNSIPTGTEIVNGTVVNGSYDVFEIGSRKHQYYRENEKYVKLQEKHFVLNNVIDKIAKSLSNANFTDSSRKVPTPLLDKVNNPNLFQSKEEFLKEFAIFILSAGWTLIWKKYKSVGFIDSMELININPDCAEIKGDTVYFEYQGQSLSLNKKEFILFYDIKRCHDNEKGVSRIRPLRSQLDNISDAQRAKSIQLHNSAKTIISPKAPTGNNMDEGLDTPITVMPQLPNQPPVRTQKDDMQDKLNYSGMENVIIVATKGVDATNLSSQLATVKYADIVETDLLAVYDAYSFPIELSPYGKETTYSNKIVAEASLYDNEIIPLANSLIKSLNAEFNGKVEVDYNHVAAVQSQQAEKNKTNQTIVDTYGTVLDTNAISVEEYRKILMDKGILKL